MSIVIKIHLYRNQQSTKQQKYLLTYIPQIHPTIASFIQFAITALKIQCYCENKKDEQIIVQHDGFVIPHCLDAKILSTLNQLTIKVNQLQKSNHINEGLWTAHKLNQHAQIKRMEQQHDLSDGSSSTPKFSQDGIIVKSNKSQPMNIVPTVADKLIKKKNIKQKNEKKQQSQTTKSKTQKYDKNKKGQVVIKKSKKQSMIQQQQQSSSSQSSSLQSDNQEELEEQQQEIKVKNKKNIKRPQLAKGKKIQSFKKQSSQSQSLQSQQQQPQQQQQSGNESSSQSSQSSEQQLPRVIRTKKAQLKQKIHSKQLQKYHNANNINEKKKLQQQQQSIDDDKKKLSVIKYINIIKEKKKQQRINNDNKPVIETRLPVTYAQRKKLIQADDIESSDSSSEQQSKDIKHSILQHRVVNANVNNKPPIMKKTIQTALMQQVVTHPTTAITSQRQQHNQHKYQQQQITYNKSNNNKMLPPSLRNKTNQKPSSSSIHNNKPIPTQQQPSSSFKQHQLQQWLPVTKQTIQKYKSSLKLTQQNRSQQTPFLKPINVIRFKQIQLDQQKFIPKQSQWIQGTVYKVQNDGKIILNKVTQLGKQYRQKYDVYEYNMVVLEVNKNYLTQQQLNILTINNLQNQNINKSNNAQNINGNRDKQQVQQQQKQQQKQQSKQQDKNSVQKFICGQVNYYFGDKNYPFDLFMQMHANKHPQKYIPIRFLLNFPKIKKILKDENKLIRYLTEDQKRSERNFEIDQQRRLIRKRVININKQHSNDENDNNNKQPNNLQNEQQQQQQLQNKNNQ